MYLKINDVDEHVCPKDLERVWFDQTDERDQNPENIYRKRQFIFFVYFSFNTYSVSVSRF